MMCTVLAVALVGCAKKETLTQDANQNDKKIKIVVTNYPLYDFVRAIVGDYADLTMLIKPGTENHSYEPSPEDIIKIQNSDVFIYIGGENDQWVETIMKSMPTTDKKVIKMIDHVNTILEETVEGMAPEEQENESVAEEAESDEHIWTSPKNAIRMITTINKVLCELDLKNADDFNTNTLAYTSQLELVDKDIKGIVDRAQTKILVFGDRFPFRYFVDEFGLEYRAAFNGCSTETEASVGTLAYLIDFVKKNKIPYVYHIELSNENIAKSICEQTGANMLQLHSCHNVTKDDFEAGVTYLSLMQQNAETLRKGLQ